MADNSLDWTELTFLLAEKEVKDSDRLVFAEHKSRFTKVAFDMFRENDTDMIWKIEQGEDGVEYIVRTAMRDPETTQSKVRDWVAVVDSKKENVVLAYKGSPIQSFSKKLYHFDDETVGLFKHFLVEKTANKSFVNILIRILPEVKQAGLKQEFPELFK